jgi:hypothetical protein
VSPLTDERPEILTPTTSEAADGRFGGLDVIVITNMTLR